MLKHKERAPLPPMDVKLRLQCDADSTKTYGNTEIVIEKL